MGLNKEREIRVIIFGAAGDQGLRFTRFLTERNAKVVAAVDLDRNIGKDLGELAGIEPLGTKVVSSIGLDLKALLEETKPNFAVDCTLKLSKIYAWIKPCIEYGCNIAMIGESSFFPQLDEPELYQEMDTLCKQHGVTAIGLGVQDANWVQPALVYSTNMNKINSLNLKNVVILDNIGPMDIKAIGVNLTESEFFEFHKDNINVRSNLIWGLAAVADELGLHFKEEINHPIRPLFAPQDFECRWLGTIQKGKTMGREFFGEIKTEEGISLTGTSVYTYAQDGYEDDFSWHFDGAPSFTVNLVGSDPAFSTTLDIIHRIPDIINAQPGYLTVKDLPKPFYKHFPFEHYIKD